MKDAGVPTVASADVMAFLQAIDDTLDTPMTNDPGVLAHRVGMARGALRAVLAGVATIDGAAKILGAA